MIFGPFIDVLVLIAILIVTTIYRKKIASWFSRIPFPTYIVFLISSLPFIIFEENVNCLPSGCHLIPITVPFLLIYLSIIALIMKWTKTQRVLLVTLIFSVFGTLFELFLGASSAQFQALPPLWIGLIFIWTIFSYAILMIVPLTVLVVRKNRKT